jgi:pilus assembly protein Flp/PilA
MNKFFFKIYIFFICRERGATAVEYAIMASLIAAVVVVSVFTLGEKTNALFQRVNF